MMPDTIPEVTPPGGVGAQLKQLIPMLPALLASAKGNPEAMSAFMEGYQRSMAQLQASGQSAARLGMDQADQQQRMTRQAEQDRIAAEDRQRRMAMERVQIAPTLAQMGASADTPQGAESSIDAAFAQIADAFGGREQLGGMRDAAIHMATQTITGRQRADVEKFLAKWEHSDRKPEIEAAGGDPGRIPVQLPEHLAKHLGKPQATLGELQAFARLPLGAPPVKTRTPAAAGSFEEYSDPSTPAERKAQIEADRKRYMQSDDRPRVNVTMNAEDASDLARQLVAGNIVPSMLSKRTANYNGVLAEANRVSMATTGKPYNAARAQTEYASANRFMAALNGQQQQRFRALASAVVNTIDEVKSLSTELNNSGVPLVNRAKLATYAQTMGNSPQGQLAARYIGAVNTLKEEFANLAQGGYAPTEAAWSLANQQINGDFGVKQMDASLTEVQRLINFRMQAFENLTPYGVSTDNPVVGGMGGRPSDTVLPPAGGGKVRMRFDSQGNPIP